MVIVYIICLFSIVTFILFGLDKRRAVSLGQRIPEATLLLCSLPGGIGGFLGMLIFHHKTRKWKFRILLPLFAVTDALFIAFLLWASVYYHAEETAVNALQSDRSVRVERTNTGWLFDGPADDDALIFYPGAKVDERAYAPLLHSLAESDMDVYLVKMPHHLALLGMDTAGKIIADTSYDRYFIGGHSLGGAMAAAYAADHADEFDGQILLAAYPTKETAVDTLIVYGTEDKVLNKKRVEKASSLVTGRFDELVIRGGNHAQFGDYGEQRGDGKASVSSSGQQEQTVLQIRRFMS